MSGEGLRNAASSSSSQLRIKIHSTSKRWRSRVYCLGSVFVDEEEREGIEGLREKREGEDGEEEEEEGWVEGVLSLKG